MAKAETTRPAPGFRLAEHNRKRHAARGAEPKPTSELGVAPKHFDKAYAAIWQELASLAPPGVLANSDRVAVEVACLFTAKMRTARPGAAMWPQLTAQLGKLAMMPADRSKVQVSAPEMEADDPWNQSKPN